MKRVVLGVLMVLGLAIPVSSCSIFRPKDFCKDVCHGDVSFAPDHVDLGGFRYDQGDNTSLVGHCGFDYVDDRTGGYGNTLEVQSEPCGIHLVWAFNRLLEFNFDRQYQGQVKQTGLRMGDPISKFKQLYPDYGAICDSTVFWKKITTQSYHHVFDDVYIVAYSDRQGTIDSLQVTGWWDPEIWGSASACQEQGAVIRLPIDADNWKEYVGYPSRQPIVVR